MGEKWTSGMWTFAPEFGRGQVVSDCKGWPRRLVATVSGQKTEEEREANAHLIAAAPDMLVALQYARQFVGDRFALHQIDGAIAKAIAS